MIPLDITSASLSGIYTAVGGWYVTVFVVRMTRRFLIT